ncbi:homogentisate phytyltransferase [Leptolyngbya sp. PCC 6406]|uniref:homogentisate phytyltransferase n=1 Tax=Leptolyngbya sp. PCC 6406 TaxID=1173264 RepID=UPI0002ACED97|nr:homogentisate phytyltransferase [Leptolyngbya sp. PCC 6406]
MGQSLSPKPSPSQLSLFSTPLPWLTAFWKFSRPHTIVGTSLSVIGVFAIAWTVVYSTVLTAPPAVNPFSLILPLIACLAGNVYIVGLNQIHDVEIDRINKPQLPIASGEFSRQDGWWIVGFAGFLSTVLAALGGWFLLGTILISLAIGTAYSLPPIRLKRFPFWASICILTVRGAVVNLGLFLHYSEQLGLPLVVPAKIWALTAFVLVFSIVIAIFKDIPDLEGDLRYNIATFTVRLGQQRVFNLARWILTACYLGLALAAPWIPGLNGVFLLVAHGVILALFWWRSRRVSWPDQSGGSDTLKCPLSFTAFYQFIWQLFFLEYLLYPIACGLGS